MDSREGATPHTLTVHQPAAEITFPNHAKSPRMAQSPCRTPSVVQFIRHLHRQLGRKLILVWDRWSVHRSAARELLHRSPDWLQIEWLPAYAPDLNPVEAMWSYTKHGQLANFLPDDIQDLEDAVVESIADQHYDTKLKQSFFQTAQLDL
jgi:transposase